MSQGLSWKDHYMQDFVKVIDILRGSIILNGNFNARIRGKLDAK